MGRNQLSRKLALVISAPIRRFHKICSIIVTRKIVWDGWQMNNQIIEVLEAALIFSLNPIAWVIVIFLVIWAKQIWIPAVSGVVVQVASLVPLAIYLDKIDEASLYDLLGGDGDADIVFLFSVPVLSGMIISALVIPLVRRLRKGRDPAISP